MFDILVVVAASESVWLPRAVSDLSGWIFCCAKPYFYLLCVIFFIDLTEPQNKLAVDFARSTIYF